MTSKADWSGSIVAHYRMGHGDTNCTILSPRARQVKVGGRPHNVPQNPSTDSRATTTTKSSATYLCCLPSQKSRMSLLFHLAPLALLNWHVDVRASPDGVELRLYTVSLILPSLPAQRQFQATQRPAVVRKALQILLEYLLRLGGPISPQQHHPELLPDGHRPFGRLAISEGVLEPRSLAEVRDRRRGVSLRFCDMSVEHLGWQCGGSHPMY